MSSRGTITKLEPQKRRKNRLSVYLDDAFAFGVDAELAIEFGLHEGDELSEEQVREIIFREEKRRAKQRAYRILAGRAHSEKELREKLLRKGVEARIVEEVIAELKEQRFLDDRAFALAYARSRMIHRPVGEFALRSELWQKGVEKEIIEAAVREAYAEKDQRTVARELAAKRARRYKNLDDLKRRQRLWDFLIRRGFDWQLVQEVLEDVP